MTRDPFEWDWRKPVPMLSPALKVYEKVYESICSLALLFINTLILSTEVAHKVVQREGSIFKDNTEIRLKMANWLTKRAVKPRPELPWKWDEDILQKLRERDGETEGEGLYF